MKGEELMAAATTGRQDVREFARRAVFGWIGPAVLHETNNVLTVLSGVRQVLQLNLPMGGGVGALVDPQVARGEARVNHVRALNAPGATVDAALVAVHRLLDLCGKGRGVTVRHDAGTGSAALADPEAFALALFLAGAIALPPRGLRGGTEQVLRGSVAGPAGELVACGVADDPRRAPEWRTADELMASVGGQLLGQFEPGQPGGIWRVTVLLSASAPAGSTEPGSR